MPELPEVETVVRSIRPALIGKAVQSVWTSEIRLRTPIARESFQPLVGTSFQSIERVGKYLLFRFPQGKILLSHLGMSGRYLLLSKGVELAKHTHLVFCLEGDLDLHYIDPRRFGSAEVFVNSDPWDSDRVLPLELLGPDALSDDFTVGYLKTNLQKSTQPIKAFLLDQTKVAGLGNIYALEALFHAGIHPERPCADLKMNEIRRLRQAIISVLSQAIERGGTTLSDGGYVDARGQQGNQQNFLKAYGRQGQPCLKCGTAIRHFMQRQRSTYFCPVCQQ